MKIKFIFEFLSHFYLKIHFSFIVGIQFLKGNLIILIHFIDVKYRKEGQNSSVNEKNKQEDILKHVLLRKSKRFDFGVFDSMNIY